MKLYTVQAGKAKSRMKPVFIDELHKCLNYIDSRWHVHMQVGQIKSGKGQWFQLVEAPADAKPWKHENGMTNYWKAYKRADKGILPRT